MAQATATIRQPKIIERPRLTTLLDECGTRIILLVAPAGYGKTTLARQWLRSSHRRHGWYGCSEASADVAALAAGIAQALRAFSPDALKHIEIRLRQSAS